MFSSLRAECGSAAGAAIPRQQHARGCGHSPLARRKAWVFSGWTVCLYVFVESRVNPRATGVHRSNALKYGEERREIHLIQGTMPNGSPAACVQPLLQQGGAPRRAGGGRRVGSQCHEAQDGRNLHGQPQHNVASKVLLCSSLLPRTQRNAPHSTLHPRAERPTPLAWKSKTNVVTHVDMALKSVINKQTYVCAAQDPRTQRIPRVVLAPQLF